MRKSRWGRPENPEPYKTRWDVAPALIGAAGADVRRTAAAGVAGFAASAVKQATVTVRGSPAVRADVRAALGRASGVAIAAFVRNSGAAASLWRRAVPALERIAATIADEIALGSHVTTGLGCTGAAALIRTASAADPVVRAHSAVHSIAAAVADEATLGPHITAALLRTARLTALVRGAPAATAVRDRTAGAVDGVAATISGEPAAVAQGATTPIGGCCVLPVWAWWAAPRRRFRAQAASSLRPHGGFAACGVLLL